ncbi:PIN domain-containing protein [Baaleninema sp.]|uniref:PIN domain-containing protein n=1 Tax=Baaleninema sp. TaxID=3101197 RepID=UPI003D07243F
MRRFVSRMTSDAVRVESMTTEDLVRVHQILEQYSDTQLDFTDAAIVAIAERLNIARVYTLDLPSRFFDRSSKPLRLL